MTLRLAFMGTPDFAVPTLAELIASGHELAAVYTRAPKRKGRGLSEEKSPVHKFAEAAGLPIRTPSSLKSPEEQQALGALKLDAAIVVAYGLLLPKPILEAPRLGCFNLHASLLPRWRGAAPIQRAIMACDAETGVMVMRMEEGLDTGPVLLTERVAIGRKTYGELHDELARIGADLMGHALSLLEEGKAREQPQDYEGLTYAKKVEKAETRIDWTRSARALDCHIRGLSPFPGAWFEARGERIKLLLVEPVQRGGAPGEVLPDLSIACGSGALKPLTVQRAGKAPMDFAPFQRGFKLEPGETLS
jgi:methionyl-tRNA formyltransferase